MGIQQAPASTSKHQQAPASTSKHQQAPASTSTPTTAKVAAAMIATTSESAAAFVETPSIVIQTVTKRVQMTFCHRKKCKSQSRSTCFPQVENASFGQKKHRNKREHFAIISYFGATDMLKPECSVCRTLAALFIIFKLYS